MRRQHILSRSVHVWLTLLGVFTAMSAQAIKVSGVVADPEGEPVPFVRITISGEKLVPTTTTVFTTADGSFETPEIKPEADNIEVEAFRIGWQEVRRRLHQDGDNLSYEITVAPKKNVADRTIFLRVKGSVDPQLLSLACIVFFWPRTTVPKFS